MDKHDPWKVECSKEEKKLKQEKSKSSDDGNEDGYTRVHSKKRVKLEEKHEFTDEGPIMYKLEPCIYKLEC